ncbi:MAG: amidohydrolase family protein, partial [Candidatus Acidiferrales bacterium]
MKRKKKKSSASQPQAADLLLLGGTVLTLDDLNTIHLDGAVAIQKDRIVAVGPRRAIERRYRSRRVLDARDHLVLPGLVNAHSHVAMTLFRGVSDDQELLTWLEKYMFPLEARFVSADFVRWGARLACWEMIASGTTTFADGFFFSEVVATVADETGLRAVPGQGIFDVPTPDAKDSAVGLHRAEKFLADWRGHPRITPSLFPHSCYTVTPETFRRVQQLAARYDAPVQVHLAESQSEMTMVRERYATTPVRHLANLGVLDGKVVAAHCVWLDEEEIRLLAERRVSVVHCPESNMKLGSGVA